MEHVKSIYTIEKKIEVVYFYEAKIIPENSYIWINPLLGHIFDQTMEPFKLPVFFKKSLDSSHKPFSTFFISLTLTDFNHFKQSEDILNLTIDKFFNFVKYCEKSKIISPGKIIQDVEIIALYELYCISKNFECNNKQPKRL